MYGNWHLCVNAISNKKKEKEKQTNKKNSRESEGWRTPVITHLCLAIGLLNVHCTYSLCRKFNSF